MKPRLINQRREKINIEVETTLEKTKHREYNANTQQKCTKEITDYPYGIILLLTPLNFGSLLSKFISCNSAVLYATSDRSGKQMQ